MKELSLLTAAFATDIGRKRTQNQDNGTARPDIGLVMVADGMGGHQGGETASAMAVEAVVEAMTQAHPTSQGDSPSGARALIASAIESANQKIFKRSSEESDLHGMGTTTTALYFRNETLTIGHVGDSRCYLLRPGKIWQLTRDHSLVQEKLRAGLITRGQVKTDRLKNVITRSVGFESKIQVETYSYHFHPEDVFLICSDGLTGQLDDLQISAIVDTHLFQNNDVAGCIRTLIEKANDAGGDDNVTAAIACFMRDSTP